MWSALAPPRPIPWLNHVKQTTRNSTQLNQCRLQAKRVLWRPSRIRSSSQRHGRVSTKNYIEQAIALVKSTNDGGPPRWFMPLECGGSRSNDSPLLLYLPGIDGLGLGLVKHHQTLGELFEVWCLHIPFADRTQFSEMVKLVEDTIRSENKRRPNRPIYLVGEGVGGCLAISVAANNPHIDLVLILANPATYLSKFRVHTLKFLLAWMRSQIPFTGERTHALNNNTKKFTHVQPMFYEGILEALQYNFVIASVSSIDTIVWKLETIIDATTYTESRLHKNTAQTQILSSGITTMEEAGRLSSIIPNCHIRRFDKNGYLLFLDDGFDFVYSLKRSGMFRRGKRYDCIEDYSIVTPQDITKAINHNWFKELTTCPTMFSTLENGEIVSGLAGFPREGPTLLVGYHMLTGADSIILVNTIFSENQIHVRGLAHPNLFHRSRQRRYLDLSSLFDSYRIMGCIPVSGRNLYKLLQLNSHVLLYPGGMREAFHRKGEEYKLFWPEKTEFVRIAAKMGATIVPFGVVGEDDFFHLCADYDDLMKFPFIKHLIDVETNIGVKLRSDTTGEVAKQPVHVPLLLPKVPGRLYFLFGKPIETKGRQMELRDKKKAQELYLQIKEDVKKSIAYLQEKREKDPFRNFFSRLLYRSIHGFNTKIPSFDP